MKSAARNALTGLICGTLVGFAVMHVGCEPRTFEASQYFVLNLFGALFMGLVGTIVGWCLGILGGKPD
jgi:hypothetical protein